MPEPKLDPLDRPIKGGRRITIAKLGKDRPTKREVRETFYELEKQFIDASKIGGTWYSTLRRLRNTYAGRTSRTTETA